jgi:hypothetical protein
MTSIAFSALSAEKQTHNRIAQILDFIAFLNFVRFSSTYQEMTEHSERQKTVLEGSIGVWMAIWFHQSKKSTPNARVHKTV